MDYLDIASYIGTLAFAISGIIIGIRKEFDIMGVFILAFLTSSGGGVLRDVLLDKKPAIFENQSVYIIIIILILIFKFLRSKDIINKLEGTFTFRTSDTIGLVAFAISGGETAILMGSNLFTVIIISFLTAVGGGIIRDMLVNEVPVILKAGFYGSNAALIGLMLYILNQYGIEQATYITVTFLFGIVTRYYAVKRNFHLPKI